MGKQARLVQVHEALAQAAEEYEQETGRGIKGIAASLAMGGSTFYQLCEGLMALKAKDIPAVHRLLGPGVIECLAALCGGTFQPNESVSRSADACATRSLPTLMKELADVIGVSADALKDGQLSELERKAICNEAKEAQQAITNFIADINATCEEQHNHHTGRM